MSDEKKQFRDVLIKLAIVCVVAILYSLGGADFGPGKWVRRYVATFILCGGCYWFSRDWRTLVGFPFLVLGTSLGYGADVTWLKIVKRFYCGFIIGIGASMGDILNKRIIISLFLVSLITFGMIILGVWNNLPNARTEELVVGVLIALPIFSARRRTE